jgi:hypothetical protein
MIRNRFPLGLLGAMIAMTTSAHEPWMAQELPTLPKKREPSEPTFDTCGGTLGDVHFDGGAYTAREVVDHVNAHSATHSAELVDGKTIALGENIRGSDSSVVPLGSFYRSTKAERKARNGRRRRRGTR